MNYEQVSYAPPDGGPYYTRLYSRQKITASLRLTGDWLLWADFRPGDVNIVEMHDGQLTIRLVE